MSEVWTLKSVTLDTNVIDDRRVIGAATRLGIDYAAVSVTDRELAGSSIESLVPERILAGLILGESPFGQFVFPPVAQAGLLESILRVIGNGSFPPVGSREALSSGQRRQLRDAIILLAHLRQGRDALISNDKKAFLDHGRRGALERLLGTRILTAEEFLMFAARLS